MSKIHQSMIAVMREVSAIEKDRKNAVQNYTFRGIDDIYNDLHAKLAKHGVYTLPKVISERSEERTTPKGTVMIYRVLTMSYTFVAEDGSSVEAVMIGEGMDSGDKAANKAMSVAQKYAFLQVFSIPTKEDKDPEVVSETDKDGGVTPKGEPKKEGKGKTPSPFSDNKAKVLDPETIAKIESSFKAFGESAFDFEKKRLNGAGIARWTPEQVDEAREYIASKIEAAKKVPAGEEDEICQEDLQFFRDCNIEVMGTKLMNRLYEAQGRILSKESLAKIKQLACKQNVEGLEIYLKTLPAK